MKYNIHSGVIRWQIYDFTQMAIVMFALSLTVCEIFAKQEKCRNFDLENEEQGQEGENGS